MISQLPNNPFQVAERYIQLRKRHAPERWADTMSLLSDMILMPIIILFLVFLRKSDMITFVSTAAKAYSVWREHLEYTELRYAVQRMFFHMKSVGGPFIVTNNETYMPYVFADAVQRSFMK